jgi:PAS domain S-box-containing protein
MEKELYDAFIGLASQAVAAQLLQEDIVQREERFRALFNYSPDAVLVLNTENGMWTDGNANASEMFALSHDDLLKSGPAELSPSHQPNGRESGEYAIERINEALESGTNRFEWVHRDANGRDFDCEIRLAILPGGENELLVNISDITQRKAAQQAIVQGDRLKSEFLANMSHELRTPLNSILGYTDVLLMGLDGELDEEVTTDLEAIHDNSQHLLNLINDILDLAKIEAGRMTIELGDVNVSHLLQEVKKTSAGLLVNKEVEMVVEAEEELPPLHAEYHRVYQVVNSLVSNAVKFTEKGTITLRALAEGDEMVLQVEDTGIGISKEALDMIFEEFTQADTSSTRQHEGTGLGLTITRRLVQMHGGTISVESEVGKGSTFTARFPLQAKVNPELLTVVQSPNGNK